jgi:hypothetical protein
MISNGICTIFSGKRIAAPLYEALDRYGICEVYYEKGKYLRCPCCVTISSRLELKMLADLDRDTSVLINKEL